MVKIIAARTLISSLVACLLVANTAQAEDLFTVYQHAKEADPQVLASEAGYLAALENRPQALASLGPNVTLSGSARLQDTQSWSAGEGDNSLLTSGSYQLGLSKPFYNPQLKEQLAQTDSIIAQAEQSLISEQQNLILRVAEAYFTFLNARDSAELARAEATAIERQNKQVEAYFDAGRSAVTDLKESQSRYDQSLADIVVADQNVDIALESLRSLTNRYYKVLRGATNTTPLIVPAPAQIDAWSKTATSNNKDVIIAELAVRVAQKSVDIARAGKKPTVDLFARHNGGYSEGESNSDSQSFDASIGFEFSMNLYDSGKSDSEIRQARFSLRQAIQDLEAKKRSASQETRSYYLNIVTGLTQIKALKRSLESSEVSRKATEEGFRAGTRTAVDVLLAYSDTYQAQSTYATARNTFLLNTVRLKHSAGTLSETDLQTLSRILNRSQSTRQAPVKLSK
jgi:outer membrane protein